MFRPILPNPLFQASLSSILVDSNITIVGSVRPGSLGAKFLNHVGLCVANQELPRSASGSATVSFAPHKISGNTSKGEVLCGRHGSAEHALQSWERDRHGGEEDFEASPTAAGGCSTLRSSEGTCAGCG